jgi:diphosphomevalonate decarboxylase
VSDRSGAKATASAPANIALIKYWGARDLDRALPLNPSISMTLAHCRSRTTVELLDTPGADRVELRDDAGRLTEAAPGFAARVHRHLDEIRRWAGLDPAAGSFRVATENSFPAAAGLASSAAGVAALTVATTAALGRPATPAELSALARRSGSGSAARSVLGGWVEWPAPGGAAADDPHAAQIAPAAHWPLRDLVAIVEAGAKDVSSLDGHRRAATGPHLAARLAELPRRLDAVRRAIAGRDFAALAPVVEEEAIELHLVAMSSRPPIFYWKPATLAVLEAVRALRAEGVDACSTMDAGANVHVLCTPEAEPAVAARLAAVPGFLELIHDRAGDGPALHDEHLF